MTLSELHERIGWQLEGRLQVFRNGVWTEPDAPFPPCVNNPPGMYRRRPDAPTLPDEVWLSDNQKAACDGAGDTYTAHSMLDGAKAWHGGNPTRYIRADGVIDGARLQCKFKGPNAAWHNPDVCEYRFKP